MRRFHVTDWERSDLMDTGRVRAVSMRPQRLAAAEPYCIKCEQFALPTRVSGRWDQEMGYTARPFEPVWVLMSCGCTFGDATLAQPHRR